MNRPLKIAGVVVAGGIGLNACLIPNIPTGDSHPVFVVSAVSQTVCDTIVGTQTDNVTVTMENIPQAVTSISTVTSQTSGSFVRYPVNNLTGDGTFLTGMIGIPGSDTQADLTIHVAWSDYSSTNVVTSVQLSGNCKVGG